MIFRAVVELVPWKAVILYGVGASIRFGEAFGVRVPTVPSPESEPKPLQFLGRPVFVSPTLAPPSYRSSVWPYLERVVLAIAGDQATSEKVHMGRSETRRLPTAGSSRDQRGADHRGVPTGLVASDANLLVWERLQNIAATTGMRLHTSETQCSLNGGPEHASTTRVFRQQFAAKKPELLVRDDVMRIDPSLATAGNWVVHTNPVFHRLRTDDLGLICRILGAVDKFARANAP
jgi:hypothetical protein